MDPIALSTIVGTRFLAAVVAILTKRYLLGLAVLVFAGGGVAMLVLSAFLASGGWWQNVLIEAGSGLLFVGLVDLAILGALRRIIDPSSDRSLTVQFGDGPRIVISGEDEHTLAAALRGFEHSRGRDELDARLEALTTTIQRLDSTLKQTPPAEQ